MHPALRYTLLGLFTTLLVPVSYLLTCGHFQWLQFWITAGFGVPAGPLAVVVQYRKDRARQGR